MTFGCSPSRQRSHQARIDQTHTAEGPTSWVAARFYRWRTMDLGITAAVFPIIFLGELPDKTMFASLVLASRGQPRSVWVGAAAAFLVHVSVATTATTGAAATDHPRAVAAPSQ